jgi:hypothetical protein
MKLVLAPSENRPLFARNLTTLSLLLLSTLSLCAQQTATPPPADDKQTIQTLLQRIDRLEASEKQLQASEKQLQDRVRQLEKGQSGAGTTTPADPPVADPTARAQESEPIPSEKTDVNKTLLNIRGFGDFGLYGGDQKGQHTSFGLGELNLFITSDISEKFKFLTELVFEVHQDNDFEEDLERVLLEYDFNDYFKLSGGRFDTAIGYYNTAFHHTTWFQTTTDRPYLFHYEDEGGILPVHSVGLSATGAIPSGRLGLHYVAQVSNGRASSSPNVEPVQNLVDENNHKAVNFALFARPDAVPGLQAGFSTYRDVLYPSNSSRIGETIMDAYAVLNRPSLEWLNEAVLIRHALASPSHIYETPGFYSQVSERFGAFRPYLRYQYVNAPKNEPVFPLTGLRAGPSVGVRYDVNESVALKLQYDHSELRQQPGVNTLGLQAGFTF